MIASFTAAVPQGLFAQVADGACDFPGGQLDGGDAIPWDSGAPLVTCIVEAAQSKDLCEDFPYYPEANDPDTDMAKRVECGNDAKCCALLTAYVCVTEELYCDADACVDWEPDNSSSLFDGWPGPQCNCLGGTPTRVNAVGSAMWCAAEGTDDCSACSPGFELSCHFTNDWLCTSLQYKKWYLGR